MSSFQIISTDFGLFLMQMSIAIDSNDFLSYSSVFYSYPTWNSLASWKNFFFTCDQNIFFFQMYNRTEIVWDMSLCGIFWVLRITCEKISIWILYVWCSNFFLRFLSNSFVLEWTIFSSFTKSFIKCEMGKNKQKNWNAFWNKTINYSMFIQQITCYSIIVTKIVYDFLDLIWTLFKTHCIQCNCDTSTFFFSWNFPVKHQK